MDEVSIDKLPKTSRRRHHHERIAMSEPSQSNRHGWTCLRTIKSSREDVSSQYQIVTGGRVFAVSRHARDLRAIRVTVRERSEPSDCERASRVTAKSKSSDRKSATASERKSASRVTARVASRVTARVAS
ncbi:hypothetical protein YC2023_090153 [Brassica napus]